MTANQNQMYQLANKFNLPQNLKNDSLGLWYDSKTKIASCMSDLKF